MSLKKLIKEEINKLLQTEVRYIDTDSTNKKNWKDAYYQDPIKNEETLRVFHGCDNLSDALIFAKYGTSGKERHARKYSYEMGMNPAGIFVTTDFKIAAEKFSYGHVANVVIEFSAKVTDLDTPVWNNSGSYFGQGSNPQPFRDRNERETQKQSYNDEASKSDETRISQSDNKALAQMIFANNEHQALYSGDLNPNMIKRFWVKNKETKYRWIKLNRAEFLKKFSEEEISDNVNDSHNNPEYKLYKPNDDYNGFEDLVNKVAEGYKGKDEVVTDEDLQRYRENLEDVFDDEKPSYHTILQIMYPKQIIQAKGEEWYRKFFNKFH